VAADKIMEIEEKYDLGADEMAEGFGDEGEGESGGGEESSESYADDGAGEF
jgi:hypothetical protein